jgi:hypothetical protein
MNIRRVLVLLAFAQTACGGGIEVTHVLTGPPVAAKQGDAPLPVYFNRTPDRPYREIAQIRVRSTGTNATAQQVIAAAAEDARELGADAIIADMRRHYHSVQVHLRCNEPDVDPEWRLNARVIAIKFVPPGAADPEPVPVGPPATQEPCE